MSYIDEYNPLVTVGADTYDENYLQMLNKGIQPEFRHVKELDVEESKKRKEPVFFESDVVLLHTANDPYSKATHPVTDEIIRRFPKEYAEWKLNKAGLTSNGIPLAQMPGFDPLNLPVYEAFGILSVEMLAEMNEGMFAKIPQGREMRTRAIAFLEKRRGEETEIKVRQQNEELMERIKALEAMVADKPRRGRPPKSDGESEANEAA